MTDHPDFVDHEGLLACARGEMFGLGNPQLPLPPMLMFDRIIGISADGGPERKGHAVAEFDIRPDLWFFGCHFVGDPVMPGCLGLDALWQLTGFNLAGGGCRAAGGALGVGEVKFTGMVTPANKLVEYTVNFTPRHRSQAEAGHGRRHHEGGWRDHLHDDRHEGRSFPGISRRAVDAPCGDYRPRHRFVDRKRMRGKS